jgi:hypothetical protein
MTIERTATKTLLCAFAFSISVVSDASCEEQPAVYEQREDVAFAQAHGIVVVMDIFTPTSNPNGIGIVDVASGAWSSDRGKIRDHQRARMYDIFCARGYTVFAILGCGHGWQHRARDSVDQAACGRL